MDPKWETKSSPMIETTDKYMYLNHTNTYLVNAHSPTTPRRNAGMLESPSLECASPTLMNSPYLHADKPQPQTPSLLSRLFSWGTPTQSTSKIPGKPPLIPRRNSLENLASLTNESAMNAKNNELSRGMREQFGYRSTPTTPLMIHKRHSLPLQESDVISPRMTTTTFVTATKSENALELDLGLHSSPISSSLVVNNALHGNNQDELDLLESEFITDEQPLALISPCSPSSSCSVNFLNEDPMNDPMKNPTNSTMNDHMNSTMNSTTMNNLMNLDNDTLDEVYHEATDVFTDSSQLLNTDSFLIKQESIETLADGTRTPCKVISEFDPLNQDWMLRFDTPTTVNHPKGSLQAHNTPRAQQESLIDSIGPLATPNSICQFTQRDLDELKKRLTSQFEREFEVAQLEIQEMEQSVKDLNETNKKTRTELSECLVKLSAAQNDREKLVIHLEKLQSVLDSLKNEKNEAIQEKDLILIKYKQLKMDYDDMRENQAKLLTLQETEKEKIYAFERRYEVLKSHAESKLDEANVEIARVRSTFEKEISTLKTKLSRSEVNISSLERSLKGKELENQELTKICDGLVLQMESCNVSNC